MSKNEYDIDDEIFFSYPLSINKNKINIIDNLELSASSIEYIKNSEKELLSERDIIKDLL